MATNLIDTAQARLQGAKASYATRRVRFGDAHLLLARQDVRPRPGDVVLAEVTSIGHHEKLELADGRRAALFVGDEILVVYGNRYAPDQFEAETPDALGPCDLVAAGGIASMVISKHATTRSATRIKPVGLLADAGGKALNLSNYAEPLPSRTAKSALVLAVLGSSMNAGKTTTAVALIRGLKAAGYKVGAAKITGTGAGGDVWQFVDAGAEPALDFTDAGYASTYRVEDEELETIFKTLTSQAMSAGCDAVVIEVADGVYQRETAAIAGSTLFRNAVDGVVFAVRDALSAATAVEWTRSRNLTLLGITGAISQSPLAMQEAMDITERPVFTVNDLHHATGVEALLEPLSLGWRKSA